MMLDQLLKDEPQATRKSCQQDCSESRQLTCWRAGIELDARMIPTRLFTFSFPSDFFSMWLEVLRNVKLVSAHLVRFQDGCLPFLFMCFLFFPPTICVWLICFDQCTGLDHNI